MCFIFLLNQLEPYQDSERRGEAPNQFFLQFLQTVGISLQNLVSFGFNTFATLV